MNAPGFNEVRRNVAGIDLAGHADHYVCGSRRDDGTHEVVAFGTTTGDLLALVQWLKKRNVVSVAMESTSVYWIPLYDLLESNGIEAIRRSWPSSGATPARRRRRRSPRS